MSDKVRIDYEANMEGLDKALQDAIKANLLLFQSAEKAGKGVDDLGKEMNEGAASSKKMADDSKKAAKELDNLNKTASKTPSFFGEIKKQAMSIAAGITVASALNKGYKVIVNTIQDVIASQRQWETNLKELQAITGASTADLNYYREAAKKVSVEFGVMGADVVTAYKLVGSAKPELLANRDALASVTREAVALAKASGLEVPDAVNRLTAAMNQFGAPAEDAGKFVNILAEASKLGSAEVPVLTEGIIKAGSAARAANVSFAETSAVLEAYAEKGLIGAEAGTQLRNVLLKMTTVATLPKEAIDALQAANVNMQRLSDTTLPLQERLQELAKIQGDAGAITKVFGVENFNAASLIIEQRDRVNELTIALGKQGLTTAYEQAAINLDTLAGSQARLSATWDVAISQEGGISNLFRAIVDGATRSIIKIDNLGLYFRLMFRDIENLGKQDLNKLLDVGVTNSEKTIASFLAPFEQVSEIDFQKNAQVYKKQFVDALVLEGEEIGDATALFDQYIRNRTDRMIAGYKANKKVVVTAVDELNTITTQTEDQIKENENKRLLADRKRIEAEKKKETDRLALYALTISNIKDDQQRELAQLLIGYEAQQEAYIGNVAMLEQLAIKYETDRIAIIEKYGEEEKRKRAEKQKEVADIMKGSQLFIEQQNMTDQQKELDDLGRYYEEKLNAVRGYYEAEDLLLQEWISKENAINEAYRIKDLADDEALFQSKMQLTQDLGDASIAFANVLAGEQSKSAEFQKQMALFQIGIDTAVAIAGVVRAASSTSLTPIDQAIKIASGTAIVLTNVAKAKQLLTEPPAYKDGVIDMAGKGTGTSDSNLAWLSKGESVITAKATQSYKDELTAMLSGRYEDLILSRYVMPAVNAAKSNDIASKLSTSINMQAMDDSRIVSALMKIKPATSKDIDRLGATITGSMSEAAFKASKKWQA